MAAKRYLDENGLTYTLTLLKNYIDTEDALKVDKETGKGLSTNDYTTAEKTKLAGIEADADVNVIESIKLNGSALTVDSNKQIDLGNLATTTELATKQDTLTAGTNITITGTTISATDTTYTAGTNIQISDANVISATDTVYELPAATTSTLGGIKVGDNLTVDSDGTLDAVVPTKTSELTNDSDYQTETEVSALIADAVADITSFGFEIVESLPTTGEKGIIYLVSNSGSSPNSYDEYIWVTSGTSGSFEKIGTTDIDLSNYVTFDDLSELTNTEIKAIWDTI